MAFDVTGLQNYVELKSKEISSRAVSGSVTADLLIKSGNYQVGVKKSSPILKLGADVVFQNQSSCSRVASGSTKLSNALLTVTSLSDIQNYCSKDLEAGYYSYALNPGQDPEKEGFDTAFIQYVMDYRAKLIAAENEKLLWRGDTSLSSGNLNKANGLLKIVKAGSYVDVDDASTNIVDRLIASANKMPVDISSADDFYIFMGKDIYNQYKSALFAKNIYQPTNDNTLAGTDFKIQVVPGLNGTKEVIMTRLSNLQLGQDLTNEDDSAKVRFSMETNNWYIDFYWSIGIAVKFIEEVGYADYSS